MAGFFGLFDYSKEGPGVSKNGPKKRPFVVFFEIYGRKFWKLIIAGLLHALVSLPVVTRGWADAGLTFITRSYSREKHAFLKDDFFETIRKNRGQAFVCGLINLVVSGLLAFNAYYYLFGMMPGLYGLFGMDTSGLEPMEPALLDHVVMAATMIGFLIFTWMKYYVPFLVITFKLTTKQVYKNAFIFSMAGLKVNLLISAVMLLLHVLAVGVVLLFPNALVITLVGLLWLLLVPAFRSLLIQFAIFPTVRRLMIDPYYKDNPNADKQARLDLNLEVEEDETAPADEPVFSDEALIEREEPAIPHQYSDRELRQFNNRVQKQDDDDDTI